MNTVVIASSEQDSAAVEAVKQHHAQLSGALSALVAAVAAAPSPTDALAARDALVRWTERELVPHARAEEKAMYPPAHRMPEGRLLVDAMLAEHELILGLVARLRAASTHVHAAADARALEVTFESHVAKENEQILPLLAQNPEVSVAEALHRMHELLGGRAGDEAGHARGDGQVTGDAPASTPVHGHGDCACGEADGLELPELDARQVPHAIRHATVFGALDALRPGGGLVLVAPHDPLPLLRQVEDRAPGVFTVDYLQRGPEAWRLRFLRA